MANLINLKQYQIKTLKMCHTLKKSINGEEYQRAFFKRNNDWCLDFKILYAKKKFYANCWSKFYVAFKNKTKISLSIKNKNGGDGL